MFAVKLLLIDDHEEKCAWKRISRMAWAVAGKGNGEQGSSHDVNSMPNAIAPFSRQSEL